MNATSPQPARGQRMRTRKVAAPPSTAKITARTPLPKGWASFCSEPDSTNTAHWYATAPWNVIDLKEQFGPKAEYLTQMVDAPTWVQLHREVAAQVTIYEGMISDAAEG
ncbi:hypothetical protein [Streptomyces sp. NPDC006132]|uniref:hypothetical protein n=1 Tax=Streptomyces sp. NPDC006132 TaxID=3156732 RepID=UPI00340E2273